VEGVRSAQIGRCIRRCSLGLRTNTPSLRYSTTPSVYFPQEPNKVRKNPREQLLTRSMVSPCQLQATTRNANAQICAATPSASQAKQRSKTANH
jgi:hypothetical protein